ncbi:putative porin [Cupriavidus metallidurans]|jgi:predicted porin|uniref:porin n=1 Tax=Cupriavidus metallidurans TaxID=119219 RepID=UPI0004937ADB|nr:porin [Cupriavidus metallidurans]KWW39426.1 Outer membrane porin protein [Cupriavidus metallidurans]MDE4920645.1 porin [Cupriavidus metallidurans]
MKFKLLAIAATSAAASLAASSAYAQSSVTLYGVADAGVEYLSKAAASNGGVQPGTKGQSLFALQSGNQSGSRWGLRGIEDLGGGLKGIFTLESGFNVDDGKMGQSGRLFGRAAYVGLQNQWGRLTLGRHTTPGFDFGLAFDPMSISSRYSITSQDPWFASRADNSAKYMGTFGGLTVSALYSLNNNNQEVPGNFTNGREYSFSAIYAAGPFSVGAVYDQTNRSQATALSTNKLTRHAAIAGTYAFGQAKVFAGYRYAHAYNGDVLVGTPSHANGSSNLAWAGLGYQVTPALSLAGAAYYQNLRNANAGNPWQFVALADYSLSKRTDLYASMSYALNNGKSTLGVNGFNDQLGSATSSNSEGVQPGANQFGAVVGVRHKF